MGGAVRGAADGREGGPGGSERGAVFEAQVRAALVRLHDLPAMQRQPLASLAPPPREARDAGAGARRTLAAGRALQRALLDALEALRETEGTPPTAPEQARLDRWLARAMATVGVQVCDAVWAEGRAMTREEAVAYALAEDGV